MIYDTKIAIIVRNDLQPWQKLNITAFLMSGICATQDIVGEPYKDKDGKKYLPMSKQPILIFAANREEIKEVFNKIQNKEIEMSIYTEELFSMSCDEDIRAKIATSKTEELNIVGIGMRGKRNYVDRILKNLKLHS